MQCTCVSYSSFCDQKYSWTHAGWTRREQWVFLGFLTLSDSTSFLIWTTVIRDCSRDCLPTPSYVHYFGWWSVRHKGDGQSSQEIIFTQGEQSREFCWYYFWCVVSSHYVHTIPPQGRELTRWNKKTYWRLPRRSRWREFGRVTGHCGS